MYVAWHGVSIHMIMLCQNPAYQRVHALSQPPWYEDEPVGAFPGSGYQSFPPWQWISIISPMLKKVLSGGMIQHTE